MALTPKEQALVDAINTSSNKVAQAFSAGTKAIADILARNNDDELTAQITPILDTQNAAADALLKIASDADPVVTPGAPPIVIPEA